MAWVYLFVAGLLEIGWAIGLKYSDGFTKPLPSILTVIAMTASIVLLAIAVRTIPIGTGYAVWTGIGAIGTAMMGVVLFSEPLTAMRALCLLLIVSGVLGLKFLHS